MIIDADCATREVLEGVAACDVYIREAPAVTFLELTAEWWTAIGTIATAAIALLAAGFAGWQVWVMRRTREDETRPYVVVDVQPSEADFHLVNLVVENIGRTAAHNVRLSFDPRPESTLTQFPPIADSVLLTEGVHVMPPGRRIQALFDRHPQRGESDLPRRYDVTVRLDDARGRPQAPQRYVLDLQQLSGLRYAIVRGPHDTAKALEGIAGQFAQWTDGRGRLRVHDDGRDLNAAPSEQLAVSRQPVELLTGSAWLRRLIGKPHMARVLMAVPPLRGWLQRRRAHDEAILQSLADASEPLE